MLHIYSGDNILWDFKNLDCLHPLLEPHLIVVEGFACLHDSWSYVVGDLVPLLGSPMANRF